MYDGQIFEHDGHKFRFRTERDDSMGAPWEEHDGHGIVSDWTTRAKAPGEMVLCSGRHRKRYYDFAATVRIARRDGWNAKPYDVPGETRRQRAAKAAMADFERLRAWCNDEWEWCGVVVELLDDSGDPMGETDSLWGIESDAGAYFDDVAHECAAELLHRLENQLRRANA